MKTLSIKRTSLIFAAAALGAATAAAADSTHALDKATPANAAASTQLAASDGPLRGGEIRRLLSGRTAHMVRKFGPRTNTIDLRFGADGSVTHRCTAQHVNVGRHTAPRCRTPRASGTWTVKGRRLCIVVGNQRCFNVVRAGRGYVFRSPSGKGRPYAGRFSMR